MRKLRTTRKERKGVAFALTNSPDGLLAPLNRAPQSRRSRKAIELVRALQAIEREEADYETAGPVRAPHSMYARANEILSAYRWIPSILPPPHEPNSFRWKARTVHADWENSFVFWVLNQRANGNISLIRSCRNCQRWFYAVTNHQTYCIDTCRQQFHSRDDHFKEQRRLYMRRYRKNDEKRQVVKDLMTKKNIS